MSEPIYSLYTTTQGNSWSHTRLGQFEDQIQKIVSKNLSTPTPPNEFREILIKMGIQPIDKRIQAQWELAQRLHNSNYRVEEMKDNSGVFQLIDSLTQAPIAMFKPGSQRACTENAIKGLAEILGLGAHFVECRFAILASNGLIDFEQKEAKRHQQKELTHSFFRNLSNSESDNDDIEAKADDYTTPQNRESDDKEITVKTWKSTLACYSQKPNAMVGIIEPFVSPKTPVENDQFLQYTKLILLFLVAGVRDAKQDGQKRFVGFDADDAFPRRTEPLLPQPELAAEGSYTFFQAQPCQTDMPLLEDFSEMNNKLFNDNEIQLLTNLVLSWNEKVILRFLNSQHIQFADTKIEQRTPNSESFLDETGSLVKLREMSTDGNRADPNDLVIDVVTQKPIRSPLTFDVSGSSCMFNKDQIKSLLTRMRRIRCLFLAQQRLSQKEALHQSNEQELEREELDRAAQFLETHTSGFTPTSIVKFVDPYYEILADFYVKHPSGEFRVFTPDSPARIAGRQPPQKVTPETEKKFRKCLPNTNRTPNRTPPPLGGFCLNPAASVT